MKTFKLIVNGIVQRVGYRSLVERIARKMKIKGYVKNLDDDEYVLVIAQHKDQEILEKFVNEINVKTDLIYVERIEKEEIEEKEFKKFEIIRGSYEEENAERLDIAAYYLDRLGIEIKTGNEKLTNEIKSGNEKIINEIRSGNEKLTNEIRTSNEKLTNEIKSGNEKIIHALDTFHKDTIERFDVLDIKYGKVSEELGEISKNLKELVAVLQSFKQK